MILCRASCAALAVSWDGLVAAGDTLDAYLDAIAPNEDRAAALVQSLLSDCEILAGRGYLARILRDPWPALVAPYRNGHAGSDIAAAARHAGAVRQTGELLDVGDVVIVAGPEHAFIWLGDGLSIEGGERVPVGEPHAGVERIGARGRVLELVGGALWDAAAGGLRRRVVMVVDVEAMAACYGAADGYGVDG